MKTGVSPGSYQLIHTAFLFLTNEKDRNSVIEHERKNLKEGLCFTIPIRGFSKKLY